jgi:hypothetical protein
MSKSTLVLALVSMIMTAVAAGLWFTRPPDSNAQVAALEARLREAEAVIARLKSQQPAGLASRSSEHRSSASESSIMAPHSATTGTLQGQQAAPPPQPAVTAPPVKADKRLAEAEARYADLINQFGLQPDEKEAFKDLAAKRDDIRKAAFAKLSDPTLTPAQRQAILADAKAQMGQLDDSVRQFLNNDTDYNTFQKWEAQNIERGQLDSARNIFEKNGVVLTPEQESILKDQWYQGRQDLNRQGLGDPYNADTLANVHVDQNYINRVLAAYDAASAVRMQNARSQFTPQGLAAYQAVEYQNRVQLESRLWSLARTSGQ